LQFQSYHNAHKDSASEQRNPSTHTHTHTHTRSSLALDPSSASLKCLHSEIDSNIDHYARKAVSSTVQDKKMGAVNNLQNHWS